MPARGFQRVDRPVAVDAALWKRHQRHGLGVRQVQRRAADPVQVFLPGGYRAAGARLAFDERHVQVAAFQAAR
ncbi:hypothetical protein D9M69_684410 [compost metagenome]